MSPQFNYTDAGSQDAALGLPQPAWTDPISSSNYCAPLNIVNFNSTTGSFDNMTATENQFTLMSELGDSPTPPRISIPRQRCRC